jgi:hypothetical protein
MPFPGNASEWRGLWADLLRGAGTGLLELDGSSAARAALAGLEVFDAAQERRQQQRSDEPADNADQQGVNPQTLYDQIYPALYLSPVERAHFEKLSPEDRQAWLEEMADTNQLERRRADESHPPAGRGGPAAGQSTPVPLNSSLPPRRSPMSASPFAGWSMGSVLPFGPDGQLNIPTFRR